RNMAIGQIYRSAELATALRLVQLAQERPKPDLEREDGYQKRDWVRIEEGLKGMDRRFSPAVDQTFLVYALQRYVNLPKDQRLSALDDWLGKASSEKELADKVAKLYANSK